MRAYIEDSENCQRRKMIRDLGLASWPSMEDHLFIILIRRRDITLMIKKLIFLRETDIPELVTQIIQMELQAIMNIFAFMMICLTES